jgi:hypothetical protein
MRRSLLRCMRQVCSPGENEGITGLQKVYISESTTISLRDGYALRHVSLFIFDRSSSKWDWSWIWESHGVFLNDCGRRNSCTCSVTTHTKLTLDELGIGINIL